MKNSLRAASIIFGLWICFSFPVFTQCNNSPDLVIVNANIITMDPIQPHATALAINDGIIQAIGTFEEVISFIPENCPVLWIDAGGYTILPGFNDSHCHWLSWPEHICDAPGQQETTYPALEVIMDTLSKHGWTSISELNFGRPDIIPEHLQNAIALEANGNLNVRVNGYWGTYDQADLITVLQNYGYEAGHTFSERIRVPGVKMYVDDPFGTMDIMDQSTCTQLVTTAHNAGYQVAAHAVNETAVEKILTAYETALGGMNNFSSRHRIEHAVKVSDLQMQRMEIKGIVASIQLMGPPDWPEQNTFQTYLSNTHTDYLLRWNDFLENNVPVVGSTDAPFNNTVCHYSPFRVLYQAVTRMGYLDRMHASWELDQRLSIEEGLKLLTVDGAWVTNEESIKGNLVVGKYADLTIVSADPLSVSAPEELLDIRSLLTMVGGQVEYCAGDAPAEICGLAYAFAVDSMMVIVSNFLEDQKPGRAFDQDMETNWGAGDFAPQYLRIDLLKNTSLDRVEFVVDQFPAGFTRHQLSAAKDGESLIEEVLHEFAGHTESLQTLTFNFDKANRDFRYLKVATLESPSWISWREIRFIKEGSTSIRGENEKSAVKVNVYPNPAFEGLTVDVHLEYALRDIEITFLAMDGKASFHLNAGSLSAGTHLIRIAAKDLDRLGPGNLLMVLHTGDNWSVSNILRP